MSDNDNFVQYINYIDSVIMNRTIIIAIDILVYFLLTVLLIFEI